MTANHPNLSGALRRCRSQLKARGFTLTRSGGYVLGEVPLHAFVEYERFVPRAEADANWVVSLGSPGTRFARGSFEDSVYGFSQGDNAAPPLDFYPLTTADDVERFESDFGELFLPILDAAMRSIGSLLDHVLDESVAVFMGKGPGGGIQRANATLKIADAFGERETYRAAAASMLRDQRERCARSHDTEALDEIEALVERYGLTI